MLVPYSLIQRSGPSFLATRHTMLSFCVIVWLVNSEGLRQLLGDVPTSDHEAVARPHGEHTELPSEGASSLVATSATFDAAHAEFAHSAL